MSNTNDTSKLGLLLPDVSTAVPGPKSIEAVDSLSETECPAITARRARRADEVGVDQDPIVWSEAAGANVVDVDGNRYVDLTSAFAVCGLGHRHPDVVTSAKEQLDDLIHAMGDVYPSDAKISLSESLAEITPGRLQQSILGLSGSDAVQSALKTAVVATGKSGVLSFWGGYHGLEYGALSATGYREAFREPFASQMGIDVHHVPYPNRYSPPLGLSTNAPDERVRDRVLEHLDELLSHPANGVGDVGAMIVEPVQGRGGKVDPPAGFLTGLRTLCDEYGIALIFDEIFTGFGRTGQLFACNNEGVVPDILCVGKAMGGGFPISAAVGTPEVMEEWRLSEGEAIHTSTFLGNPLGCAMAQTVIDTLDEQWMETVRRKESYIRNKFQDVRDDFPERAGSTRGRGLMLGLEMIGKGDGDPDPLFARQLMSRLRERGFLVLLAGVEGHILSVTPPFMTSEKQLDAFGEAVSEEISRLERDGFVSVDNHA